METIIKKIEGKNISKNLFNNNICLFLNKFRNANDILEDQVKNFKNNSKNLITIKNLTLEGYKDLINCNYIKFFKKIDKSWEEKKKLSSKISNNKINFLYKRSKTIGVYGGKISGAGGGGFLNIFAKPSLHKKIDRIMSNVGYRKQKILFENSGTISFKIE